jgi:hypothetical protein
MPTKTCQACAKMMRDAKDFPRGNFASEFCAECVDEKGHLKPRAVIRENMIQYRIKRNGYTLEEATESVDNLMRRLPIWAPQSARV